MRWYRSIVTERRICRSPKIASVGFTLIATLLGSIAATSASAQPPDPIVAAVRERADAHNFDGAILIGEADGSEAHFTTSKELRADAVWRWASITKQLAAVLVMQEVAKGTLALDAPVGRYWPKWKSPGAGRIRIRDLLLHNSGLPQPDASTPDADGVPGFYRADAHGSADSANGYCAGPLRAPAPANYDYNNCDTIILAAVLARITGKPFDRLMHDRLATPLRLRSVGIYRLRDTSRAHVAPNGDYSKEDALLDLGVFGASGGAYGTIADLWRFDRALLAGKLLPAGQREAMWRSDKSNGFYGFHQWIYPAALKGCGTPVRIVERQGLVGGIELRNYILPESGRGLILFSRHRPTALGDPYEGEGFAYDLLSIIACRPTPQR
jgi:D-alanyl-D-alanine carboxypeptidase